MNLKSCKPECLKEVYDGCVLWTGPSIPCANIQNGEYYDEAIIKLATTLCKHIDESKADLQCLYTGTSDSRIVKLPEAVQKVINKICTLQATDVAANSSLFCIGSNASVYAASLGNKTVSWGVVPSKTSVQFTYDFNEAIANLDSSIYTLNSVDVQAIGNTGNSNTTVASASSAAGGFALTPDVFPVTVKLNATLGTPAGAVNLKKTVSVTSTEAASYRALLDVEDLSSNSQYGSMSQSQYNELLASSICNNKSRLDALQSLSLQNCENIQYPDGNIHTVIQTHSGKICEALERLDNIGDENIMFTDCGSDCEQDAYETTLQDALDKLSALACELQAKVKTLEEKVESLENTVANCCS